MAIVSVKTRLGYDHEFSLGQLAPLRTFTRYYWVYSDTMDESPSAVRTASGLPQMGDVHPVDGGTIVQAVRLRRDEEHPKRWEVEVTYSSEVRDMEEDEPTVLADLERVSIQTRSGQRLIDRRLDGTAIVNSAGDLIEGLSVPWNSLAIVIEQYVASAPDYYVTSKWINAINSATWRGVPQYFAQIESLNYEETKSPVDGADVWKRTATVKLAHPDQDTYGFRLHVLDAGLRQKVAGPAWEHILDDKTGLFISKPVPLNGSGAKLAISGTPVYFEANPNPVLAFATLGI
jgi:hypothetical protein